MITLYDADRCPYCARTRIALAEKGIEYETVEVDLDDRPSWIYEKNPLGRVPVLEDDTFVLPESAGPDAVAEPDAELVVLLERPDLVVVEKPAGQPTAPIRDGETGTLANALVGRYPEMAGIGHSPREPGLTSAG